MIRRGIAFWGGRLSLGVPPSTGIREALQWLMFGRLGVLFSLTVFLVIQQVVRKNSVDDPTILLGYGILSTCFAFNLGNALVIERLPAHWLIAGLHIVFDATLASVWIHYSHGRESLFALIYLIQIMVVSLTLFQRGAWIASIVSIVCLAVTVRAGRTEGGILVWAVYSALFVVLGQVGGFLASELVRTNEVVREKTRKIEKLRELQERIVANLPTGLLTVDSGLTINFINPTGAEILGKDPKEFLGKNLSECEPELIPFFSQIEESRVEETEDEKKLGGGEVSATGSDHHRVYFVKSRRRTGETRLQQRVEMGKGANRRILRGDVAELDPELGFGGFTKGDVGGRVLIFQDVTKLVHLEEKLKQHEKLAAVGQLAAGIAHEIRNPLASMSASIEMLKGSLPESAVTGENSKLMDIAIREIDRLNHLISEFLDFVKPEKFKFELVKIDSLLAEIASSVRQNKDVKSKGIEICEELNSTLAMGSPSKLRQVIWNLMTNAIQAMNSKGKIFVGCRTLNTARVVFWVCDEGIGMNEDVLSHLYEPFFTTKDRGTGLGLATAYKIIESHNGEIRVESAVGKGTRFEVMLQAG